MHYFRYGIIILMRWSTLAGLQVTVRQNYFDLYGRKLVQGVQLF